MIWSGIDAQYLIFFLPFLCIEWNAEMGFPCKRLFEMDLSWNIWSHWKWSAGWWMYGQTRCRRTWAFCPGKSPRTARRIDWNWRPITALIKYMKQELCWGSGALHFGYLVNLTVTFPQVDLLVFFSCAPMAGPPPISPPPFSLSLSLLFSIMKNQCFIRRGRHCVHPPFYGQLCHLRKGPSCFFILE